MMYVFHLQGRDGKSRVLHYDAEKHALMQNGVALDTPFGLMPRETGSGRILRLVLGKRCNFQCAYCIRRMAGAEKHAPDTGDIPDIFAPDTLVNALRPLTEKEPFSVVQFWGGEPLLYFETIRYLHGKLSAISPDADFALCTNGSLLHGERLRWLLDNKIQVTLSWDGDGQSLRGADPLRSEMTRAGIKELFDRGRCALSPVITRESGSLADTVFKARGILGVEEVPIADAPFLVAHDEASAKAALPAKRLQEYARGIHKFLLTGGAKAYGGAFFSASNFLRRLNVSPLRIGETACFVGGDDTLTVDLRGNILTCQNFEASTVGENGESFCLGSLYSSAPTARPDLRALETRQKSRCRTCEVRMICKGGCPYWRKEYEEYNCEAAKAKAMPVLGMAMRMLTGDVLAEVAPA